MNPTETELAQHVGVQVKNLRHEAAALEVAAAGVDGISERTVGVGDRGGLSLAMCRSME